MSEALTPEQRLKLLQRLSELKRCQWRCDRPDCDGKPHLTTDARTTMPFRHARSAQLPPDGAWDAWFVMAGRGFGKTRTGAEFVKDRGMAEKNHRTAIVVPDFAVGRDVCIEGESGLWGGPGEQGVLPDYVKEQATWNRSLGELILPNGSMYKIFGTDKRKDAEALRGYQCHTVWFEEIGTQVYGAVAWDMAAFACRLGQNPRKVITGTPRPTPLVRQLVADEDVLVTHGTTYDNVDNLAGAMVKYVKRKYEGTTLGQQELMGVLLDDAKGALWDRELIKYDHKVPHLVRVVVSVDPAGTAKKTSDLTGIIVMGVDEQRRLWVLADKTGRYSPEQWRTVVLDAYRDFGADLVVAEVNFGADLVAANLRALPPEDRVPFKPVNASRGKAVRATPVVSLYERQQVWHAGVFADLEQEMTMWIPPGRYDEDGEEVPASNWSPDHMDAMVWGATELAGLSTPAKPRRYSVFTETAA